jgi:hypothetical protein
VESSPSQLLQAEPASESSGEVVILLVGGAHAAATLPLAAEQRNVYRLKRVASLQRGAMVFAYQTFRSSGAWKLL